MLSIWHVRCYQQPIVCLFLAEHGLFGHFLRQLRLTRRSTSACYSLVGLSGGEQPLRKPSLPFPAWAIACICATSLNARAVTPWTSLAVPRALDDSTFDCDVMRKAGDLCHSPCLRLSRRLSRHVDKIQVRCRGGANTTGTTHPGLSSESLPCRACRSLVGLEKRLIRHAESRKP